MKDEFLSHLAKPIDGEIVYYNTTYPASILSQDPSKVGGEKCTVVELTDNKIVFGGTIAYYRANPSLGRTKGNRVGIQIAPQVEVSKFPNMKFYINGKEYKPEVLDESEGKKVLWFYPSLNENISWYWNIKFVWNDEFTEVFKVFVAPSAKLSPESEALDN